LYDFFDHTGDIGVHLQAATPEELFEDAARALTDAITPLSGVEAHVKEEIAAESPELDLLLVDWLSELLFLFETRNLLVSHADVAITSQAPYRLSAVVAAEPLDAARHPVKVLVKAVTYHGLMVKETDGHWEATVIFDI
jgi:SHS2 domain-containing protein